MAKFPTYEEMGKNVAEKALDEFLYDGKSIREWMQIIASEDAISRQAVLDATVKKNSIWNSITNSKGENLEEIISQLPSVNSQKPCKDAISREAVLMELDKYLCGVPFDEKGIDIVIKELPSVKPQIICPIHGVYCEDCSAYEKKLNKWIGAEVLDSIRFEIEQEYNRLSATRADETLELGECLGLKMSLKIIDKYKDKTESEEKK